MNIDTSKGAAGTVEGGRSGIGAAPNGALPELIGFAAIALVVMGLLATGYSRDSKPETAASTAPASQTTGSQTTGSQTTGMSQGSAQPADSSNQPKVYQPANPTPDTRSAPTSSNTGVGDQNGSTGQSK